MNGNDAQDGRRAPDATPDGDLSARLKRLDAELDARRPVAASKGEAHGPDANPSTIGQALRMSSEFMAGVLVGGGLGYGFDRWLGTSPWGLIGFLMLGFMAGIYNVLRASGFLAPSGTPDRSGKPKS